MIKNLNYTVVNETVLESISSGFYIFDVPENITVLYDEAFRPSATTLTTINFLGDKVVSIGENCTRDCSKLINLNLSQCPNLQSIGSFAFLSIATPVFYFPPKCPLSYGGYQLSLISEFVVDKSHSQFISDDGILYNKNKTILYAYPPQKQGDNFTIPSGVKIIYQLAFATAAHMKYISFPQEINEIQGFAFGLSSLIEVIIPQTVTSVGIYAFQYCPNLRVVQFHCNLSEISLYTFRQCVNLHTIVIIGNPAINEYAFQDCKSLCEIYATELIQKQIMKQISFDHCHTKHCNICISVNSLFHPIFAFIFLIPPNKNFN